MAFRRDFRLGSGNRCHDRLASPAGKLDHEIDTGYLIAQCPAIVIPEPRSSKLRKPPRGRAGAARAARRMRAS
jgi:hypothetical protein